jgi:hypothetical protein
MGVEVEFSLDGRTVSRKRFFEGIAGEIRKDAVEHVEAKLESVRCPDHGERPEVTVSETTDGFDVRVTGCCDKLVRQANDTLR